MLDIFGFADAGCVKAEGFALESASVCIGGNMTFSFSVEAHKAARIRLEYGIDYVKANGSRSRKIFQISELSLKENERKAYTKNILLQMQVPERIIPEPIRLRLL